MSEGEFFHGPALSDRIRLVCAADEVDCAVAFWGGAIRDDLFPRWKTQRVRIICDISMNCNSRQSLIDFGAPDSEHLHVLDGLHAKVFVSAAGAIVGSANASAHGVGSRARGAVNLEAGICFAPHTEGWRAAKAFFEECLQLSGELDRDQLDRAPVYAGDPGKPQYVGTSRSLLDAVVANPAMFGDILFIGEIEQIEESEEKESEKRYRAFKKSAPDDRATRELIIRTEDDLPFRPRSALMYWRGELRAYRSVVDIASKDAVTLWGELGWKDFWAERRLPPGTKRPIARVDAKEKAFVRSLEEGSWAKRSEDLAALWQAWRASP